MWATRNNCVLSRTPPSFLKASECLLNCKLRDGNRNTLREFSSVQARAARFSE